MYPFYITPTTLDEALATKADHGDNARIIAGGTDLLIELDRGVRKTPDGTASWPHRPDPHPRSCRNLGSRWPDPFGAAGDAQPVCGERPDCGEGFRHWRGLLGNRRRRSATRFTVAGNIITASPANDAIVPLVALDATVTLQSAARGTRTLPLTQFSTGFRKVDLAPDEILTRISFPTLASTQQGTFIKLGLRRAQAISVITVAAIIDCDGNPANTPVQDVRISMGAVAPVIVRAAAAERYLAGKVLTDDVIAEAARLALESASPIDDIRSTATYRRGMVQTLVGRILRQLRDGAARAGWGGRPVLLWGKSDGKWPALPPAQQPVTEPVEAIVNGQPVALSGKMTLLDSLRAAGFVGVKEGCAEGECGACTVFLDGVAVMACLIPAERARGSEVITIEGLGNAEQLHPVQQAIIQSGGVQCGYCTPGFLMSAAKLLEERPQPTRDEAAEALTGNLCRCTGYRKILDAVVQAGK
ncbi:MAG: 2Fe-2S iron-sulfur cluster-binding protein [Caldilineaceae bacterium]